MASRYWVGGVNNWDATVGTKWATTSGGAGGASVPTAADDVFFDAVSTGPCTIPAATTVVCRSLTCTGYTGAIAFPGTTSTINIGDSLGGALTLSATMTLTLTSIGNIGLASTSTNGGAGWPVTTAGLTMPNLTFNGVGGKWTMQDGFSGNSAVVTLTNGTLDTNSKTISCNAFNSNNSNVRTLTLGSSSITVTLAASTAWNVAHTNLTMTANTATVTLTGAAAGFSPTTGANQNGISVVYTGAGIVTCSAGTVANLTRTGTAAQSDGMRFSTNLTVTNLFTITGNSTTSRVLVDSSGVGTARTITAGSTSLIYTDFMDIAGAGAAAWTGTSLGNCGGNSGITFDAPVDQHWISSSGGNWSDVTKWTSRVPLPQDNVFFDVAFISGQIVTGNMWRLGATIDWSLATWTGTAPQMSGATNTQSTWYGSLILKTGMATLSISGNSWVAAGRGVFDIDNKGISIGPGLTITAPGGTYNLRSSYIQSNGSGISAGSYNTNNFNVSVVTTWSVTGTANCNFGTSTFTNISAATGTFALTSTGNVIADQATFTYSGASPSARTFAGGSHKIGTLNYTGTGLTGVLSITGANNFGTLNIGPTNQVSFPSSTITTIGTRNIKGVNNGFIALPGVAANYISTPNAAPLQITGDITIDVRMALASWSAPAVSVPIFAKYSTVAATSSYLFWLNTSGRLFHSMSDGVTLTGASSTASLAMVANSVNWVRMTRQQSTGTLQFYTSTNGTTWTQLGTDVIFNLGTAYNNSSQLVEVGTWGGGATVAPSSIYRARVYNGYQGAGTLVFDADFTTKTVGANSFAESSANGATVTINGIIAQAGDGRTVLTSSTPGTPATLASRGNWNIGANSTLVSGDSGLTVASSSEMDYLTAQDITGSQVSTAKMFFS